MIKPEKWGKKWKLRVSCGYDSNGKRIIKRRLWTPPGGMSEAKQFEEAQKQTTLFEIECRGSSSNGSEIDNTTKLCDFAQKWLREHVHNPLDPLADSTAVCYELDFLPRILDAIGHKKLKDINQQLLKQFYAILREDGMRLDTKYFPDERVAELIRAQGISHEAFAKKVGKSVSVIKSCVAKERKNINRESAEAICAVLGINIDDYFTEVRRKDRLSNSTVTKYHAIISSMLQYAVEENYIPYNPAFKVKRGKKGKRKRNKNELDTPKVRFLDEVEAAELLEAIEDAPYQYKIMIFVLIYTGMRRAELHGLTWDDIWFDAEQISVNDSILYIKRKGVQRDTTKTANADRTIDMQPTLVGILRLYKEWFDAEVQRSIDRHKEWIAKQQKWIDERKAKGSKNKRIEKLEKSIIARKEVIARIPHSMHIFTNFKTGRVYHPDTITTWFREKLIREKHLPDACVHTLRHTSATLMLMADIPPEVVAKILGHVDAVMVSRVYGHAIKTRRKEGTYALGDKIEKGKELWAQQKAAEAESSAESANIGEQNV